MLNERGVPSPGSYWSNKRSKGWPHTTILGCYAKASGILRNPIYKGTAAWNKRAGKKRPGTGKRVQRRRPESEWLSVQDESLRIVPDDLWNKVQSRLEMTRATIGGNIRRGRPPKYLLSGLLVCGSCGGHYVVRNGRSYCCSSQANGRDVFCDQKRYVLRSVLEDELLGGIKAQLLDDNVVKSMAREIRKRARQPKASKRSVKVEIAKLDRQIDNVVDALATVGKSEALAAKLSDLEAQKAALQSEPKAGSGIVVQSAFTADKQWRKVVSNLENLKDVAEPDEVETARGLLRQIVGAVEIKDEGDGIFGYTRLNAGTGYKAGAQGET